MNNLIFLSFYLIFYFSGIGINKLFSRKANDDLDILNNSKFLLHDLYPLLSLFVLGNLNLAINLLTTTAAGKGHLNTSYPIKVLNNDVSPGFKNTLALKDLKLAL